MQGPPHYRVSPVELLRGQALALDYLLVEDSMNHIPSGKGTNPKDRAIISLALLATSILSNPTPSPYQSTPFQYKPPLISGGQQILNLVIPSL